LVERWSLTDSTMIADTPTAYVFRARHEGNSVIIKTFKDEGLHELDGLDYLNWRDGRGAVRVLDNAGLACLMEDAGTVTLRQLHEYSGEAAANKILSIILPELFELSPLPFPKTLPDMHTHFSALFEFVPKGNPAAFAEPMRIAAEIAWTLLSVQSDIRPLHGDIHHDNVVTTDGNRWLVIDPQGLIGDPHYDVANLFGNPDGNREVVLDMTRAARLADMLAARLDLDRQRILLYAIAHSGLSAAWSLKGRNVSGSAEIDERLALIPLLCSLL
jgi:streptomycin 6-kinase